MKLGSVWGIIDASVSNCGRQQALSTPISNMNALTIIFLLLFAPGLTASQGGSSSVQMFFCDIQGCAAKVTYVFCNDKCVFNGTHIADCTGPPPPKTVCQQDGHAFVSFDEDGDCDFEGEVDYIQAKKCTGQSNICNFIIATVLPSVTEKQTAYIAGGVCGGVALLVLIVSLLVYFCKRHRTVSNIQQVSVTVPLREIQTFRDTHGGPELDDDSAPSQPDHGA